MPLPFYTIGHSTRTIEDFVELLRVGGVGMVIDIRTVPRSRTNPQYNGDSLGETLAPYQVGHGLIPALGGGETILHLTDRGRAEPARLSEGACATDGLVTYPAGQKPP